MEHRRGYEKKTFPTCPAQEKGISMKVPDREMIACMTDPELVRRFAEKAAEEAGAGKYILPVWQNLEALAFGTKIAGGGNDFTPGTYCVKRLSDIQTFEFDLLDSPLIRAVLGVIPSWADKPLILETEAPFSILAGLMNPMDLYLCFKEEGRLLSEILKKIADASAEYIKACLKAGCRLLSVADPAGTMDLVGEEYYSRYCGPASLRLMKKCDLSLDRAVMHICPKMSRSLIAAGLADAEPRPASAGLAESADILYSMAEDVGIHFTGMTCIHDSDFNWKECFRIIPLFPDSL